MIRDARFTTCPIARILTQTNVRQTFARVTRALVFAHNRCQLTFERRQIALVWFTFVQRGGTLVC